MDSKALADIVEQVKQGDVEAFAKLYAMLSKPAYYYALKLLQSESDAQDVMQDTMLQLYLSIDNVRQPERLAAYANRMVHNNCMMHLRKGKRSTSLDEFELQDVRPEEREEFLPEEYALEKEKCEEVLGVIDQLKESHRMAILLYYYQNLSTKQIARLLEEEDATIRNRLTRARQHLKKMLSLEDRKGAGVFLMAIPTLTRILTADAADKYTNQLATECWQSVCAELNISATVAQTTTATATNLAAAEGGKAMVAISGKLLAFLGAAVVLIGGAMFLAPREAVPAPEPAIVEPTTAPLPSVSPWMIPSSEVDIFPPIPQPSEIDSSISEGAQEGPGNPPAAEPWPVAEQPEESVSDPPASEAPQPTPEPVPVTSSAPALVAPTVTIQTQRLTLPAGGAYGTNELLAMAGVFATNDAGESLPVALDSTSILWSTPGSYFATFTVPESESTTMQQGFFVVELFEAEGDNQT